MGHAKKENRNTKRLLWFIRLTQVVCHANNKFGATRLIRKGSGTVLYGTLPHLFCRVRSLMYRTVHPYPDTKFSTTAVVLQSTAVNLVPVPKY